MQHVWSLKKRDLAGGKIAPSREFIVLTFVFISKVRLRPKPKQKSRHDPALENERLITSAYSATSHPRKAELLFI